MSLVSYTVGMDQELKARIDAQDALLAEIYKSVESTRKYFLYTLIGTAVMFFLPLIGLMFAIPTFLSVYSGMSDLGI